MGQGLLLDVPEEGTVVLTCHHVVAKIAPKDLMIRIPQENGELGAPVSADYDSRKSQPSKDAAVLRIPSLVRGYQPLLHELNLVTYDGILEGTVLTHQQPSTFNGQIRAATPLDIGVASESVSYGAPERYRVEALRLAMPTDARPGISGSVVLCEEGVLGFTHFSRGEGPGHTREAYVIPLRAWAEDWPALAEMIRPLIDIKLRNTALIKEARDLEIGTDIVCAGYEGRVYLERQVDEQAREALNEKSGCIVVGRPKSGKTRLIWNLLRENPEKPVIMPYSDLPPSQWEAAGLEGKACFVFFDDLHQDRTAQPLSWQRMIQERTNAEVLLVCTTRDGRDWKAVQDSRNMLVELFSGKGTVYTSRTSDYGGQRGEDLSDEEGRRLQEHLKMNEDEYLVRFDGTPGSLLLDLQEMQKRYERLVEEDFGGISMSRLLNCAKLLYRCGQSPITTQTLRRVAEGLLGDGTVGREAWCRVCRRTEEEGFGRFDPDRNFQIYKPYLEKYVSFEPTHEDMNQLRSLLVELKDANGLVRLAMSRDLAEDEGELALEILHDAQSLGQDEATVLFGRARILFELNRFEESLNEDDRLSGLLDEAAIPLASKGITLNYICRYEEALDAFNAALARDPDLPEAWLGKGVALSGRKRHREALEAFDRATKLRTDYPSAWYNKGNEHKEIGDLQEAVVAYDIALQLNPKYGLAWYGKAGLLYEKTNIVKLWKPTRSR